MSEQKPKKALKDPSHLDELEPFILAEPEPIEIASAYSISVKYNEDGRPQIYVKKYGNVDTRGLRREIERSYPGAAIQGLEKSKPIEMADHKKKLANVKTRKRKARKRAHDTQ